MADYKWYSNGLTAEQAAKLEHRYCKIEEAKYGLIDGLELGLTLGIEYENGAGTCWFLIDTGDIKELFQNTKTIEVSQLEGKIIEAYVRSGSPAMLQGISVNKNLIWSRE